MADKYQTQCPHCGVKFQITAQQLQLANGTVRCGSCLQVFQANKNLVPLSGATPPAGVGSARAAPTARPSAAAPPAPAAPAPQARPATPPPAARPATQPPARTTPPADDDLADMILRELEEAPLAKPATPPPAATAPRPATPPPAAAPQWGAPPPPAKPKAADWGAPPPPKPAAPGRDEPQWGAPPPRAKAPVHDDEDSSAKRYGIEENKTRISIGGGELHEGVLEGDDPFGVTGSKLLEDHELGADSADESWAKALLGEAPVDERDERVRKFAISADQLSIADNTGVQPLSGLAARLNQMEGRGAETAPAGPQNRTGSPRTAADDDLDFLNEPGLTMQDVELPGLDAEEALLPRGEAHEVAWGRDVLWSTLSVVFLLVFLGQYLAFNFRELSHDSSWRGIYAVACGAFGCQLPGESDVSHVEGANLVIRSHPTAGQALVMDAVIYNRAGFEQPFPRIELGFSDARGNPVAGRVFTPDEYLKGELAGAETMPLDTPIHLTLELVDPGTQAVNYSLRFLPPDAS